MLNSWSQRNARFCEQKPILVSSKNHAIVHCCNFQSYIKIKFFGKISTQIFTQLYEMGEILRFPSFLSSYFLSPFRLGLSSSFRRDVSRVQRHLRVSPEFWHQYIYKHGLNLGSWEFLKFGVSAYLGFYFIFLNIPFSSFLQFQFGLVRVCEIVLYYRNHRCERFCRRVVGGFRILALAFWRHLDCHIFYTLSISEWL